MKQVAGGRNDQYIVCFSAQNIHVSRPSSGSKYENERYFDRSYFLYPKEWIDPSSRWMLGEWGVIVLLLGLTVMVGAVFHYTAKRRISQL